MRNLAWIRWAALAAVLLLSSTARAQDTTLTLGATDFTLTLARSDGHVLTADELTTYFSRARCACPTNLTAGLALTSDMAANLGTHTIDAQFMVGNDCDNVSATACPAVGSGVTLSSTQTSTSTSVTTSAIFDAAVGAGSCGGTTTSTRFWAIVRLDGARLSTEPSLALTLGGSGPAAPTNVKATSSDQGLLVAWTPTGDATTLQGHQVLCSPGPASPSTAAYDVCGSAGTDGGTGPFDTYDPQFVCSGLVAVGTNSVRVHGLDDGRAYQVAVVAVGIDGTPSAPSSIADGTPAPTVGFGDLYKEAGGTGAAGCAVGGDGSIGAGGVASIAVVLLVARGLRGRSRRRERRRRWRFRVARRPLGLVLLLTTAFLLIAAGEARAQSLSLEDMADPAPPPSPRGWNIELRFGPYRPDVDSEFANRGQSARPYEQLFSSSQHLMMQLEIDRQVSHRGGTWAIGVGAGYFNVTAAALTADLSARSGDETGLRLIPLFASLVYRADDLRRLGSPLVPYAKAGLDCTLWQITDTSQPTIDGRTFGWHAAAGVSFDLTSLDPESAETLKRESGVHQLALFAEYALFRLDGFGSGSALRVGDATWFAGLMLEL